MLSESGSQRSLMGPALPTPAKEGPPPQVSALRWASWLHQALLRLTVYSTVYGSLSSWYGKVVVAQESLRNGHLLKSVMSTDGFRGRVSQVRILPGPLKLRGNS